jgi:hypothetical protein
MTTTINASTTAGAVITSDTSGVLALQNNGTTAVTVTGGNVGVGTASPAGPITVNYSTNGAYNTGLSVVNTNSGSSAVAAFQLQNDAGNRAGAYITSSTCSYYGGTNTFNLGTVDSIPFTFLTGNSERMRINTSGQLLVGTTASNGASLVISTNSGTTNWNVGPYNSVATNFYITGNNLSNGVYLSGVTATSWSGLSDERAKDIIEPITNATEKVSSLRAVIGKYKNDTENTRKSFLIAQDVQKVLPEAVSVCNEQTGFLGLAYTDVIPLLVASIQELKATVDAQATTLATQATEITALQTQVKALTPATPTTGTAS